MSQQLKQLLGTRILSEANDLKRTISALAVEIGVEEDRLNSIVRGNCDIVETFDVINRMGKKYPIDVSDLYLDEDDCSNGVRVMRAAESAASSRIFNRKDRQGARTPYYDYRDTAMSRMGPFKPEWIKELRVVNDADPENPDVAYNNGHFLHQITFFIGPVNFYWEVNGKKYCKEMNTGDSNYITPFWPHSFTSRDPNQTALILAVTYGGDVRRSQKELYQLGRKGIHNYKLDIRDLNRATTQLIQQHMANENYSAANLVEVARQKGADVDIAKLLDESSEKTIAELQEAAALLNVDVSDLLLPGYNPQEEVVVRFKKKEEGYAFPDAANARYTLWPLARAVKMPLMKGSDIEVLTDEADLTNGFVSSLHSYVYNYGDTAVTFRWQDGDNSFEDVVQPGDSIYIQPFVRHAFGNRGRANGQLFTIRVSGSVNLATQRELSFFADVDRIIESKCWFD